MLQSATDMGCGMLCNVQLVASVPLYRTTGTARQFLLHFIRVLCLKYRCLNILPYEYREILEESHEDRGQWAEL